MKKEEALKALNKIKNDNSSPARNTRSKKKMDSAPSSKWT